MTISIGCGQITWDRSFDPEQVLAEIAQAGYAGAPAGPHGTATPAEVQAQFARHQLQPAPGYYGANFWEPTQREQILADAEKFGQFGQALGCSELYVAANGFDWVTPSGETRMQRAGHVVSADGLDDAAMQRFADTLSAFGEITLRYGVRTCFHNHVGTPIETESEIERLLELSDASSVFLGPDTGHLAWAGVDPVAFFQRHSARILTAHIKDVDEAVRREGAAAGWDYGTFAKNGIFNELGQGNVDFPAILETLRAASFSGWLIVETDVTKRASAQESAIISREYLRTLGL